MWKNNNRGKKSTTDWRGRGRKFGNTRRSGTKTFNRRQSPERTKLSLKDDWGSRQSNEDKNLRYGADDERDRRPFFEDNRHVVERDSRLLDENNYDGLHSRQFVSDNPERDGFRTDDVDRYNNADLYNRDISNQNQDPYFDRRDDFVGLDQDRVYSTDREFDNMTYRVGDYDRGIDLQYDEPLSDSVRDTGMGGMPDRRLRDEMAIGEVDRWNLDNNSPYEDSLRGGLQGYDNQSVDRKDYGNIRDTKYNYGESDHVKAEYRTDKHQSDYKKNLHDLSGEHYKTVAHDRRDTRERGNHRVNNRDLVGNSSKQSYRRNDSVPCKQEKLKSVHGPKGEASSGRHPVTNIRHNETVVKQHGNQLDRPIKNENLRKSDQSRRSGGSSHSKDSRKDTILNSRSSKNLTHSKDDKESRDKAVSERNQHSSKLGSRRDETEKLKSYSKNNPNKSDFNNRAGLNSNRSRSGSKEDNKRRPSSRSTPDTKGQRSGRSKADNDSFKKPPDRQQPNSTRSSSGRRVESDFGHVKDDDILSIMADDDGFDNEHKLGNVSTSSLMPRKHSRDSESREKGASNRTKCDRDGFHRQNSKSELERNMEPVFEIHAESSASIFGDNSDRQEKYRSTGKSGGTRSSSFRDHSKEKRTVSGNKSAVPYTEDRHISTDRSAERYPKDNRESTSKRRYGRVREQFGKTGAVLREDRPDSSNNVKVGVQNNNFQRKVQNFKTGPRNGNQFSKSKFGNKNFTSSDRVKRKYLKGGFKTSGYDRDLPKFKGNYDGRQAKGREAWKSRVDDRSERIDNRNLRNNSRNKNFDNSNIEVHVKNENFDDFPLNVDQQVDSNQQIVFIPNQDMKTSVPPVVDQFGRVIYNADLPEQSLEGQIPIRYISEQYPGDGTAVGEQLVFIPFVNQMSNYSENMSNPLDNVSRVEVKDEPVTKSSQNSKSKPLSTSARAVMRKKLEAKRKKRMEEEIERKLLKKLFGTSSLAQAVKREESSQVKKKPVIKRISPPSGNKPTHIHKTVKLVKKTDGITDISDEDDADQYDSVSDLEDVSDEDDYEKRKDKRPVFRKPGQPRKGNGKRSESKAYNSDDDDQNSHDIRRVVQSSSSQESGRCENVRGQKRQRSIYDEDPVIYSQQSNARGQPAPFARKKNRRSMSPIEITVSNERYSKTSSTRRRETESNKDGQKKRGGDFVRKGTSNETRSHSLEDQNYDNEGDHHGSNRHRSGERSEGKRVEGARYRQEPSPNKFEARRNVHAHSNFEKAQMTNDRQSFGYGKYRDKSVEDNYTDKGRYAVSKYRSERDNNYRSDEQYEWERNVSDNGRLGNKNQSRSSRNDVLDRTDCHGQFDGINDGDELNRSPTRGSPSNFSKNAFRGTFQTNPSFAQQSTDGQSFSQSISIPLQFSKTGSGVDHSLPPVQNTPIPMPPFPPVSLGVRPDMSLPPPVGTMGNHSPMMQASNANNYQQSFGIQSQQHYHSVHQQFPQQQQQQMQAIQQNQSQFQMQQPMFNPGMGQNQMGMQQIQPNQFQQTQSNVGIVPLNQTLMSDHMTPQMTAQVPQLNQGNYKQVIKTSHNQQAFVATNSQGVRGVIGTIKTSGSGSQPGLRVAQVETGSPGHTAVLNRATGRTDVKHSPNSNKLPQDGDAFFDDLVQMVCSKCNCVLLDHSMMKAHGRWHDMIESNNKNWRCDQCEQGYLSSAAYSDHMSDKHTYNSWNCSLCNLSFSNSSGLNKHIRHSTHKNLKVKFVCSLCPASFMVLTHLVQHKKEIHQSSSGYSGYRKF